MGTWNRNEYPVFSIEGVPSGRKILEPGGPGFAGERRLRHD
jgi:hypothetical protein